GTYVVLALLVVLLRARIISLASGTPRNRGQLTLSVSLGRLTVLGCTDYAPDAAVFEVPPGWNRVRVSRSDVARATQADIDSDESPEAIEKIRIQVWPAAELPARVVKRWVQPGDDLDV
ncbi:hypothetical protein ABZ485_35035, partial [Streptomyces albogriseolus]